LARWQPLHRAWPFWVSWQVAQSVVECPACDIVMPRSLVGAPWHDAHTGAVMSGSGLPFLGLMGALPWQAPKHAP
jgi:hypothetical protein